jgi:hypothetical protein
MKTSNHPPADVQGLFRFEWCVSGKFEARLQPELAQRYQELRAHAKSQDFDLAWALDISSKITKKGVDNWANGDGSLLMSMSDEEYLSEYGEHTPKVLSERRITNIPYFRDGLTTTAKQCCQVVFELQRSIGPELKKLMESGAEVASKKDALRSLKKRFSKALSLLHEGKKPHGKSLMVEVTLSDNKIERIPLAARAIEVALDLATQHLKLPAKKDVEIALEAQYPELTKLSLNWSSIHKQAGLSGLPNLSPWGSSKADQEKCGSGKRKKRQS